MHFFTTSFRRPFRLGLLAATFVLLLPGASSGVAKPARNSIRVVVWDEQQPRQKPTYENFIGGAIVEYLNTRPGLSVKSVCLADPDQGVGRAVLEQCDVLVWWGHVQQFKVSPEQGKQIVQRIKAGQLSLVTLHSAHWSTPFLEAMNERTRMDVARRYPAVKEGKTPVEYVPPSRRYFTPKKNTPLTPSVEQTKSPDAAARLRVSLPNCCFPGYRADGGPSDFKVVKPDHPIAQGVPATFRLARTEMYAEPFHVPEPDEVIFEERWATGEWFRSGCVWNIGRGKVFYFRPGHETYPIYKREIPLRIIENAIRYLGTAPGK